MGSGAIALLPATTKYAYFIVQKTHIIILCIKRRHSSYVWIFDILHTGLRSRRSFSKIELVLQYKKHNRVHSVLILINVHRKFQKNHLPITIQVLTVIKGWFSFEKRVCITTVHRTFLKIELDFCNILKHHYSVI